MRLHGAAAKAIREKSGIKATAVAEKLGVTQGQVSNWEANRRFPTDDKVWALAGLLGVPVEAITIPEVAAAVA